MNEITRTRTIKYVDLINGKPATTSIIIAQEFEKRHDNVLREIKNLEIPNDFRLLNFEEINYLDFRNREQPMYRITRDGFTLLAMGFTGKKAMAVKLAFIRQFNEMESRLKETWQPGRPTCPYLASLKSERNSPPVPRIPEHIRKQLPRKQRPITARERMVMTDYYNQGLGVTAIAVLTGRERHTVSKVIRQVLLTASVDFPTCIEPEDEFLSVGVTWRQS